MVRCKPLGRRNDGDRECCGSSSNFGEREIKGTQGTCAGHAAAGQDAPIAGEGIQQIETECGECSVCIRKSSNYVGDGGRSLPSDSLLLCLFGEMHSRTNAAGEGDFMWLMTTLWDPAGIQYNLTYGVRVSLIYSHH